MCSPWQWGTFLNLPDGRSLCLYLQTSIRHWPLCKVIVLVSEIYWPLMTSFWTFSRTMFKVLICTQGCWRPHGWFCELSITVQISSPMWNILINSHQALLVSWLNEIMHIISTRLSAKLYLSKFKVSEIHLLYLAQKHWTVNPLTWPYQWMGKRF